MKASALFVADDENASRDIDNIVGNHGQVIDAQDAFNLDEQSVEKAEVSIALAR